jgi:hypothetical protein
VKEDIYRHKRQVTPGDFRRKLSPSLQAQLSEAFETDLVFFGYEV